MSFEVFEKLETKVQQAIDTIALLQMEIEELRESNRGLTGELNDALDGRKLLNEENDRLIHEQNNWQERLRVLLNKMDDVT